ncbi:hypothetical protein [Streptomyces antibioticus]|uniref:hypothetical protein n=1 Tax=Streptomyces antibioticus TaxID=1890 RepID=UPI00339F10AF
MTTSDWPGTLALLSLASLAVGAVLFATAGAMRLVQTIRRRRTAQPAPLPAGFTLTACVTASCAACGYTYDEDDCYTVHFADLTEAHKVLHGAGWTVLADGRVLCHTDDLDDHDELLNAIGVAHPTAGVRGRTRQHPDGEA